MKSRCSLGRVMLAAWFLMLCLGFVIATSLEVTAVPNNDAEIKKCEGLFDACNRGCSDPSLSPEAAAKCKSDCNRYQIHCDSSGACTCKTGQAIKPSSKLPQLQPKTPTTPGGMRGTAPGTVQRRGVEGDNPADPAPLTTTVEEQKGEKSDTGKVEERGLSRVPTLGRMAPGGGVLTPGGTFSALTKAECTGLGCKAVTDNTCPDVGALRERCTCKAGTKGVCIDAVK